MSTSPVSSSSLSQQLQQYFQNRAGDLSQLGQALSSGDLAGAQTAFNNISTLGQSGPFTSGNPFYVNQRQQDFAAVGQALQSGDLAGAQQAFGSLVGTFKNLAPKQPGPTPVSSSGFSGSGAGPDIVLNLSGGNTATPEQITINLSNASSGGGEQLSLSIGSQGSNPQEITFNLNPNSNEQITLNLLGASASTSGSTSSTAASTSGALSVSA